MGDVDALCRRIVIIDKGKMLYDNDIDHLKKFFGSYRTLKIRSDDEIKTLEKILEKELSDFSVSVSADDEWISILVNEDKAAIMEVLNAVQKSHKLRDMKLEEISTEEVVRKIYEEGVK